MSNWELSLRQVADRRIFNPGAGTTEILVESPGALGVDVWVEIDAIGGTSPTLTVHLDRKWPEGTKYDGPAIFSSAGLTATGVYLFRVFPGITAVANRAVNDIMPETYRIRAVLAGTGPTITATIKAYARR